MNKWMLVAGVVALAALLRPSKVWAMPVTGLTWVEQFKAAEARYNLPKNLLARIALQESSYDPFAQSPAGAQGIMQIVPRWHPGVDPFDPDIAIDYAGSYIRRLYDRFGTWSEALAAYNWGPTALSREGMSDAPVETRNYVLSIAGDLGLV
jgi:soluble lytic murein transglycosylase-like protein